MRTTQKGFTLIEIAIVLVIIGLLLGGVLKGQELINAARVRNIASQLDGVKIAYLGFQDRYRAYPGDVPNATSTTQIPGSPPGCTAGNGTCANGKIDPNENILVWNQLSHSGFISGSYNGATDAGATYQTSTTADTPVNPFNGFMLLVNDADYGDQTTVTPAAVLNIKTGGNISASMVAELDRKVDDGLPGSGSFRVGIVYDNVTPGVGQCLATSANGTAGMVYNAAVDIKSCGGVSIQ